MSSVSEIKVDKHHSAVFDQKEEKAEKGQRERQIDSATLICQNYVNGVRPCTLENCEGAHGFENLRIMGFLQPYKKRECLKIQEYYGCPPDQCTFLHPGEFITHHDQCKLFALYTKGSKGSYFLTRVFVTEKILKDNLPVLREAQLDFPARVTIPEAQFRKNASLRYIFKESTQVELHPKSSKRAQNFFRHVHQQALAAKAHLAAQFFMSTLDKESKLS